MLGVLLRSTTAVTAAEASLQPRESAERLTVDVSGGPRDAHAVLDGPLGQEVLKHAQQASPADATELVWSSLTLIQAKAPEHSPLR